MMQIVKTIQLFLFLYIYGAGRILYAVIRDRWIYSLGLAAGIFFVWHYPHLLTASIVTGLLICWYGWIFLYARASVAPKYALRIAHFLDLRLLTMVFVIPLYYYVWFSITEMMVQSLSFSSVLMLVVHPLHLISWVIFSLFFFLDSSRGVSDLFSSYVRAIKLILYNMYIYVPFFLSLYATIHLISLYILPDLSRGDALFSITLLATLVVPLLIILYSNLYIVLGRKQFDRYFPADIRTDT